MCRVHVLCRSAEARRDCHARRRHERRRSTSSVAEAKAAAQHESARGNESARKHHDCAFGVTCEVRGKRTNNVWRADLVVGRSRCTHVMTMTEVPIRPLYTHSLRDVICHIIGGQRRALTLRFVSYLVRFCPVFCAVTANKSYMYTTPDRRSPAQAVRTTKVYCCTSYFMYPESTRFVVTNPGPCALVHDA